MGKKEDLLVEMRFFVPGMATSGQIAEDGSGPARFKDASEKAGSTEVSGQEDGELNQADEELVVGEDGETLSAAAVFCETVKQKADIGAITSESIVRFEELLCLTPRFVISLSFAIRHSHARTYTVADSSFKCMRTLCDSEESLTTTRSCTSPSQSYSSSPSLMSFIGCLLLL